MERGGPWTSHRAGNPDCSLDWRGRGRRNGGMGREMGEEEEVKIFNNNSNNNNKNLKNGAIRKNKA